MLYIFFFIIAVGASLRQPVLILSLYVMSFIGTFIDILLSWQQQWLHKQLVTVINTFL